MSSEDLHVEQNFGDRTIPKHPEQFWCHFPVFIFCIMPVVMVLPGVLKKRGIKFCILEVFPLLLGSMKPNTTKFRFSVLGYFK